MLTKYHLKRINRILSLGIITAVIVIFGSPLIPEASLSISAVGDPTNGYRYRSDLAEKGKELGLIPRDVELESQPVSNWLVIPEIGVDSRVYEGQDVSTLSRGIWRRPKSSTPDRGGNTVLVAHRFLFTDGPNTFYHLPKMTEGDYFSVFWNQAEYLYQVFDVREVLPKDTYIEEQTDESIVTLYTCTPLWTSDKRLVVKARLINQI